MRQASLNWHKLNNDRIPGWYRDKQEASKDNMSDFLEFFKGKKILITGHTGFKGSWLCAMLKMAGAEVVGYEIGRAHV